MRGIRARRPALSSDTEELTRSPLTSRKHGVDSWRGMTYLGDTQTCILALQRVATSESLVYNRLTFPLIVLSLISIPRSTKRLWKQNSRKGDTWALSRGLSSSPLSDLSNPHPSPLLPNLENPENIAWYTISHIRVRHAQIRSNLSIQPSIHIVFPAPGELSPRYALLFIVCHQGLKLPFGMFLRLIARFLSITINGQAWSCDFKMRTALQQTQTIALASPQQVGPSLLADAGTDIFQANGVGPLSKWVDDHIFFRLPHQHLEAYNTKRHSWCQTVAKNGGRIHEGSHIWYKGDAMPDGHLEEFDEDMVNPLRDLADASERPPDDALFTYADADINLLSEELGIPWESSKTIPFAMVVPYLGFLWDLDACTVAVLMEKKTKYLDVIEEWCKKPRHTLVEVQGLYGKLLHTSLVIPAGRAYLTTLEAMLSGFSNRPFVPHTPPCSTSSNLEWWADLLRLPNLSRPIPGPIPLTDLQVFSDASSGFSIGIMLGLKWRVWHLLPGWKSDGRDIGWAEAVGELLTLYVISSSSDGSHFKVYGDNKGVVEGWWKGRSRNRQTNIVFRHLHSILGTQQCTVHTRHVPSKDNPADGPSRGIYPPTTILMPNISILPELHGLITDFDTELPITSPAQHLPPNALPKPQHVLSNEECASVNAEVDHQGEEFLAGSFHC